MFLEKRAECANYLYSTNMGKKNVLEEASLLPGLYSLTVFFRKFRKCDFPICPREVRRGRGKGRMVGTTNFHQSQGCVSYIPHVIKFNCTSLLKQLVQVRERLWFPFH